MGLPQWGQNIVRAVIDSIPLPTGASSEGTQTSVLARLTSLLTLFTDVWDSVNHWLTVRIASGMVGTATTLQNAVSASGTGTALTVTGKNIVTFDVSGSFAATISFETIDAQGTWWPLGAGRVGEGTVATTGNNPGLYKASVAGLTQVRARVTWGSGTSVTVKATASYSDDPIRTLRALWPETLDHVNDSITNYPVGATPGRATADALIRTGAGVIYSINVNPTTATPTAGLLTIYDGVTEAGTILHSEWVFATGLAHPIPMNKAVSAGIYVGFDATLANVSVDVSHGPA